MLDPIAIDWSPFAQAPSFCPAPLPIAIPWPVVFPVSPILEYDPIAILFHSPLGPSAPALYPIETLKCSEYAPSPTLTLPLATAPFPTATPFAITPALFLCEAWALAPTATESLSTVESFPNATELTLPPSPALFPGVTP